MRTIYLAWQDPKSRSWFTVGRLSEESGRYAFVYTQGARTAAQHGFALLESFPYLGSVYESDELFPIFANRIVPASRLDYPAYIEWLNVSNGNQDPLALLGRSGGRRATDTFAAFPCPERDAWGGYTTHFFAHGLRYLPPESLERIEKLIPGERLFLVHDFQNPVDPAALMLRTDDSPVIVGYCPRYLLPDMFRLIRECNPRSCEVTVEKINQAPAPLQMRLLCRMNSCWPDGFSPFSSTEYQPISEKAGAGCA